MLQRCLNTIGCQLRLTQACSVLIALTVATTSSFNSNRDNILRHHEQHIKRDSEIIQQAYDRIKRLPTSSTRSHPERAQQPRPHLLDQHSRWKCNPSRQKP